MKILPCKKNSSRMLFFPVRKRALCASMLVCCFLILFSIPFSAYSTDKTQDTSNEKEKIHISAETLVFFSKKKYLEFTGNVKASQDNIIITSDRLRIYYTDSPGGKKENQVDENSIQKIVAESNVTIKFDNKVAETDQAVYTTKDMILVLSGTESKVISGSDVITGSKITVNRADGNIKVEGTKSKPVEVTITGGKAFMGNDK
ncbi:MAG: hypothetical protein GY749_31025 [Desulfobacteraceae bacterium]|nr:hypothetical protein [Desulfobacteraceae bacterium]